MGNLIRVFTGNVTPNSEMHALAVSAPQPAMTAIEDAVRRLDVPASAPQNLEITAFLVIGSQNEAASGNMPKELDSVVTQLKNALTYKNFRLLDAFTLRARTGQPARTSSKGGSMQVDQVMNPRPITTSFSLNSSSLGSDGTIHIQRLQVSAGPDGSQLFNIGTEVDLKEGQKVVVGKTGINPNEAMLLVLTARVAQ